MLDELDCKEVKEMEWNSNKSSAWDAQDSSNYHQHLAGFGSSSSGSETVSMYSVDLKLGRLDQTLKNSRGLSNVASSQNSGWSKRGRGLDSGAQTRVSCSVDGCTCDLSQCREYHRRHRVCERHSKTPVVLIGGKEQRFCQQCSRFHSLGEFDDEKRSCRKRLDGHNRRRRKTQPETFYMTSGSLQTSYTGNGMLQFRSPQMHTANWPMISHLTSLHHPLSWSINQEAVQQPFLSVSSTENSREFGLKHSPDSYRHSRLITQSAPSTECALSLLSRYPTQSSGIYADPIMATHSSNQDIRTSLHLNDRSFAQFSCTQSSIEDESSVSFSSKSNNDGNNNGWIFPFTWG